MKNIWMLVVILGIIASFIAGRMSTGSNAGAGAGMANGETPTECAADPLANCAEFEALKAKLSQVTPEEIRAYLRTSNAEEKLKKADEILGKIMASLVASIGFRLTPSELQEFRIAQMPIDHQPPSKAAEKGSDNPIVAAALASAQAIVHQNSPQLQTQIQNATNEEEAMKVLETLGADFSAKLQKTKPLPSNMIRDITGRFEGAVTYDDKKKGIHRTIITFRGQPDGDQVKGNAEVEIYNPEGKRWSHGTSRGNLTKSYNSLGPVAYIECGGDYFELIYFPQLARWIGYYIEMQEGTLTRTGKVALEKAGN